MLNSLRQRSGDESGFTLIELLVVILIIGILAAIAIPAFLSQKSKAYDSSAKTLAQTAQTSAETYATENEGNYKWGTSAAGLIALKGIEPSINTTNTKEAELTAAEEVSSGAGYKVTATATNTGTEFSIERTSTGSLVRSCKSATGKKDCSGSATGTW
jgi:type IV pilus assembly protein PilA